MSSMYYATQTGVKPTATDSIDAKGVYYFYFFVYKTGYYFDHTDETMASNLKGYTNSVSVTDADSNTFTTDYVDVRSYYNNNARTNMNSAEDNICLMVMCYAELDPTTASTPSTGVELDNTSMFVSAGILFTSLIALGFVISKRKYFN